MGHRVLALYIRDIFWHTPWKKARRRPHVMKICSLIYAQIM